MHSDEARVVEGKTIQTPTTGSATSSTAR